MIHRSLIPEILVGLAVFCLAGTAHAEFYKWVDENGQVHFSDTPKASQAEKVDVSKSGNVNVSKPKSAAEPKPAARPQSYSGFHKPTPPPTQRTPSVIERRDALRQQAAAEEDALRKERAATATTEARNREWAAKAAAIARKRAVDRCERLGMRKNCDSDEMVAKFRDLTPEERARLEERRARALERERLHGP